MFPIDGRRDAIREGLIAEGSTSIHVIAAAVQKKLLFFSSLLFFSFFFWPQSLAPAI